MNGRRVELKYLVPRQKAAAVLRWLQENKMLLADPHTDPRAGYYTIESLYYDTPTNESFMNSVEGYPVRKKIRIRHYRDSSYTVISKNTLEAKSRDHNYSQKVRFTDTHWDPCPSVLHPGIWPLPGLWLPAVVIEYERLAFIPATSPQIRITLDINVRAKLPKDFSSGHTGVQFLHPDQAILEIKGSPAEAIKSFHGLFQKLLPTQSTRFSKYCLGVLTLNPDLAEEYWASYKDYLYKPAFGSYAASADKAAPPKNLLPGPSTLPKAIKKVAG